MDASLGSSFGSPSRVALSTSTEGDFRSYSEVARGVGRSPGSSARVSLSVWGRGSSLRRLTGSQAAESAPAVNVQIGVLVERVIIPHSPAVQDAEDGLRWSLEVSLSGERRRVLTSEVRGVISWLCPAVVNQFSLWPFWPAEFLCILNSCGVSDTLLAAAPLEGCRFALRFRVWNRQLQAKLRRLRFRVFLELDGIPPHAWDHSTASAILGPACWIERLGTETKVLGIPEPLPPMDPEVDPALCLSPEDLIPQEVQILDYPVFIHVLRVEDRDVWTDRSLGGGDSSSDDSNDVNMDPSSGPSRRKPRSRSFACGRGVADGDSLHGTWPSSSRGGGP
ncbi:hypothetical protein BRADI_4g21615v3 [Brachypodium distachyon]|uniref:DUF4283 domain-containing protein n=1 Tax=Brachypodium distachyon TaxID=15368 RepID=A0A2K2CP66_BRADI|nr:hypothetical protein BRADI_4g21615v3 [Brachypodium distachyon]